MRARFGLAPGLLADDRLLCRRRPLLPRQAGPRNSQARRPVPRQDEVSVDARACACVCIVYVYACLISLVAITATAIIIVIRQKLELSLPPIVSVCSSEIESHLCCIFLFRGVLNGHRMRMYPARKCRDPTTRTVEVHAARLSAQIRTEIPAHMFGSDVNVILILLLCLAYCPCCPSRH